MKKFIILESIDRVYRFGLHLEETEFGCVGIVNCHFNLEDDYELLLTDYMGENFYITMTDNPFSFSLPAEFSINGLIMADIFKDGSLVASGVCGGKERKHIDYDKFIKSTQDYVVKEDKNKSDEDYMLEADYYINKAKKLFSEEKKQNEERSSPVKESQPQSFFDSIKEDFNFLYSAGEEDYLLRKKFKNSVWKKVDISGEVYILGKIYASAGVVGEELPSFIALAIPTTYENATREKPLGEKAKFYHANIYDNFGFLVLVESVVSGRVVNL